MTIRRLVIAALLASAGAAHADTITPQPATPSNFVSGWTTGNGTDVLGSGVLQGNLNLVGGVAHGADASLSDVLYGKVAGTVGNVDGQTTLFFKRGIEANYLLASGHGILAATLGPGKSVVGSANGAVVMDGLTKAPAMSGGGSNSSSVSTGGGSSSSSAPAATQGGGSNTPAATNNSFIPNPKTEVSTGPNNNPAANLGQGNGNGNGNANGVGNGNGNGVGNSGQAQAAEVPEPSSIALMLLGMVGAGAITRRRSR